MTTLRLTATMASTAMVARIPTSGSRACPIVREQVRELGPVAPCDK